MKTIHNSLILAAAALLVLASSLASPAMAAGKLQIVCSLPTLADLARTVGGDRVEVTSLAKGTQDPHFVDPKPSFIVKVKNCDLFCEQGLELEIGWVPPLLQQSGNPHVQAGEEQFVDCSINIPVLEKPTHEYTRQEGDIHPFGNPHYDVDPLNGIIVAQNIAAHLKARDAAGAATYDANLNKFAEEIYEKTFGKDLVDAVGGPKLDRLSRDGQLDEFLKSNPSVKLGGWMAMMKPVSERPIIVYHKNLEYFKDRFGLTIAAYLEPKPGVAPTPGHLVDVVMAAKSSKVKLICIQPFYNRGAADLVASKAGAKVVFLATSVDQIDGVDHYVQLMDYNCKTLVEANK